MKYKASNRSDVCEILGSHGDKYVCVCVCVWWMWLSVFWYVVRCNLVDANFSKVFTASIISLDYDGSSKHL
jgi:hypothetical protein